jgi:hypothetical protein
MNITSVRARSITANDRLDAHYFTAPGVAATERLTMLEVAGMETVHLGELGRVWDPPRFARAWAASAEEGIPYLRPYDVFDYLPTATDRLSATRNPGVNGLRVPEGTLLQTCSGRNLGPCAYADEHIARFALSHDMIRIEVPDETIRAYVLVFLKTPTGRALLRRGKSGSVIDHLTTADIAATPVPMLPSEMRTEIVEMARRSIRVAAEARARLGSLLAAQEAHLPQRDRSQALSSGWTMQTTGLHGRLDAAYYGPSVMTARAQLSAAGGVHCGDIAQASLPVRYKRYYVSGSFGRPILSGRQILQLEPVNLRHVSDRSFRDPDKYVIRSGMTIFGADGRAEGSQGAAALVTKDRSEWLASNHVMRLTPRSGVRPGAVWLAIAARQSKAQINALSFGSVVDQVNPEDVERIVVPTVSESDASEAEAAWELFGNAATWIDEAVSLLEAQLSAYSGQPQQIVA